MTASQQVHRTEDVSERVESLLAIRELGERQGHVQEVIVQNFRAKQGTRMADAPERPGLRWRKSSYVQVAKIPNRGRRR